jgi:hypothetical protein
MSINVEMSGQEQIPYRPMHQSTLSDIGVGNLLTSGNLMRGIGVEMERQKKSTSLSLVCGCHHIFGLFFLAMLIVSFILVLVLWGKNSRLIDFVDCIAQPGYINGTISCASARTFF